MSGEELKWLEDFEKCGGLARSAESIIIFQMFSDKSVSTQTFGHPQAVGQLANVIGAIAECLKQPGEEGEK